MNTELAVGVFGLVGAALGAGGAVGAGWVQQWQTAKYAARDRREQRAITLGEEALLQLVHLQRELEMAMEDRKQGADPDFAALIRKFGRNAETALIRLPGGPDLQESMGCYFTLINGYTLANAHGEIFAGTAWFGFAGSELYADDKLRQMVWAYSFADRAVRTLGAFLRGEKLPDWRDTAADVANLRPPARP
ncbi:hypothetical protein [Streptomyces sp. NBC_00203]|uniref:hypothetical protein n=1 Tax=Streptomyces sp. NBC_00203 TaxID=2975680 RepID=UPI00324770AA